MMNGVTMISQSAVDAVDRTWRAWLFIYLSTIIDVHEHLFIFICIFLSSICSFAVVSYIVHV